MEAIKLILGMAGVSLLLYCGYWVISTPTTRAEWMVHCVEKKGYDKDECADQWDRAYKGILP